MLKRLSTELTLIYTALFGAVPPLIAGAVWLAVEGNSRQAVRAEMSASSAVFDRLWKLRADQLSQTAEVMARDFGFRQAVATDDEDTMLSALDNIESRIGIETALIALLDGRTLSTDARLEGAAEMSLIKAIEANPQASGMLKLRGEPFQAVAVPVNAPTLIG